VSPMNNNDFAQFLDDIREARNVTREDFVQGIISLRQYYRFIKGESTLRNDVILQLIEKLELNNAFFHMYFKKSKDTEYENLLKLYKHIYLNDLNKAQALYETLDQSAFLTTSNLKFFQFLRLVLKIKQKELPYDGGMEKIIEIADYPAVMSKEVLTFTEKTMLTYITNYLMDVKKDVRIADFFYRIAKNEIENQHSIDKDSFMFRLLAAKTMAMTGEHEKAYEIILPTEELFIVSDNYVPMLNLLYYKAQVERYLDHANGTKELKYRKSLQKLIGLLHLSDNKELTDDYQSKIENRFNLKISDLVEFK
jgi:hypothetical protein